MAVSVEQMNLAVGEFKRLYNNHLPLDFEYQSTAKEIFNDRITDQENTTFKGAYYPGRGSILILTANLRDEEILLRTLAHEIGGHRSLNTFGYFEERFQFEQRLSQRNAPPNCLPNG